MVSSLRYPIAESFGPNGNRSYQGLQALLALNDSGLLEPLRETVVCAGRAACLKPVLKTSGSLPVAEKEHFNEKRFERVVERCLVSLEFNRWY